MIVAGFGFRASVTQASLQQVFAQSAKSRTVDRLATLDAKAATRGFDAFAQSHCLPVSLVTVAQLEDQNTQTQSDASFAAWGIGSVAEATALAAAGPGARLLGPRVVSEDGQATCALAEGGVL